MYRRDFLTGSGAGGPALDASPTFKASDPAPLPIPGKGWAHWLGLSISGAVLVAVLMEFGTVDFREAASLMPGSPVFWLIFFAYYFAPPSGEWLIFHRLWRLPASGFVALVRKFISNEVLMGYIGEVYFYAWARKRSRMVGAPFGAIKDVAILSAIVGNMATLVIIAAAYPFLGALPPGLGGKATYISLIVLVVTSLAAIVFRKRLFSLPRRELRFVIGVHFARIVVVTGLAALMWHLVLPAVPLSWWVLLAALRMLLSRLPLLPNKDFVFAGLAILLIGHDSEIAALMTMMASFIMATHVVLGLILTCGEFAGARVRE